MDKKILVLMTVFLILMTGLVLAQPAFLYQLFVGNMQLERLVGDGGFIPLMKEWVGILVWSG